MYSGCFFFFKQKTAYEMRISDWSSDVCSSDLGGEEGDQPLRNRQSLRRERRQQRIECAPLRLGRHRSRNFQSVPPQGIREVDAADELRRRLHLVAVEQPDRHELAPALGARLAGRKRAQAEMVDGGRSPRTEERRVGQEGVRQCKSRWT